MYCCAYLARSEGICIETFQNEILTGEICCRYSLEIWIVYTGFSRDLSISVATCPLISDCRLQLLENRRIEFLNEWHETGGLRG